MNRRIFVKSIHTSILQRPTCIPAFFNIIWGDSQGGSFLPYTFCYVPKYIYFNMYMNGNTSMKGMPIIRVCVCWWHTAGSRGCKVFSFAEPLPVFFFFSDKLENHIHQGAKKGLRSPEAVWRLLKTLLKVTGNKNQISDTVGSLLHDVCKTVCQLHWWIGSA